MFTPGLAQNTLGTAAALPRAISPMLAHSGAQSVPSVMPRSPMKTAGALSGLRKFAGGGAATTSKAPAPIPPSLMNQLFSDQSTAALPVTQYSMTNNPTWTSQTYAPQPLQQFQAPLQRADGGATTPPATNGNTSPFSPSSTAEFLSNLHLQQPGVNASSEPFVPSQQGSYSPTSFSGMSQYDPNTGSINQVGSYRPGAGFPQVGGNNLEAKYGSGYSPNLGILGQAGNHTPSDAIGGPGGVSNYLDWVNQAVNSTPIPQFDYGQGNVFNWTHAGSQLT